MTLSRYINKKEVLLLLVAFLEWEGEETIKLQGRDIPPKSFFFFFPLR